MRSRRCHLAAAVLMSALSPLAAAQSARITVRVDQPTVRFNPGMYGIFLEEINHGVDGGLYAEMVANRAFEESRPPEGFTFRDGRWKDARGHDSGYSYRPGEAPFWTFVRSDGASGTMSLQTSGGLNKDTPYCLRVDRDGTGPGRVGVANDGWWGIGLKRAARYRLSLHARAVNGRPAPLLTAVLQDSAGSPCSRPLVLGRAGADWSRLGGDLVATRGEPRARLLIGLETGGSVLLDFVSLFPHDTWKRRPNGLRTDIACMISDLKPGFVRFPGGCVVEGGTVETAYNWKMTVGPVEQRTEQWGAWGYRRTHGLGLYEYLTFCEDLKALPLWVGFVGQTCIFREAETVPMADMGWVRDGFLDILEYANGSTQSRWGKLRAAAGHGRPFGLSMVEIGNENAGPDYEERYRFVRDALKARYPRLTCLADLSFSAIPPRLFDMNDEHYYNAPHWFMRQFRKFDSRSRTLPPAYLGEVAVTSGEGGDLKGNLLAALGEGVFLLGCERNADVVRQVSYAPLLAHVEGRSGWHGMIYHNSVTAFGTASYYLWKMLAHNVPTTGLDTSVQQPSARPQAIRGRIGLGTWDTAAEFRDLRVESAGSDLPVPRFGERGWRTEGGDWSRTQDGCRQGRDAVAFAYAGSEEWSNYTIRVRARKLSGAEGFLIAFGHVGGDQYWWNVGGWGNREHGIEFNRTPVGTRVPGAIETGRWYDLRIELSGRSIRCYLDGRLIHDVAPPAVEPLFACAGRDAGSGEVVVKAINVSEGPIPADLVLSGARSLGRSAAVSVLTSERLSDNNSFSEPKKVAPVASRRPVEGGTIRHVFPPRSLTVLRIRAAPAPGAAARARSRR